MSLWPFSYRTNLLTTSKVVDNLLSSVSSFLLFHSLDNSAVRSIVRQKPALNYTSAAESFSLSTFTHQHDQWYRG